MNRSELVKSQGRNGTRFGSTHGMRKTPTGNSWSAMMSRCFNENYNVYKAYGAIGITVCEYLKSSPRNLVSIIGERPEGKTLDRADNSGNYSCGTCRECAENKWPMNVRWLDAVGQSRNRSTCVMVESGGAIQCVSELAESSEISRNTVYSRIKLGWDKDRLLDAKKDITKHTINGVSATLREWSRISGIRLKTLQMRLLRGWKNYELLTPPRKCA